MVANASLFVPEGRRRKLAGGKSAQRARPPVAPPNGPCPSGASKKFLVAASPQHSRHPSSPRAIFFDAPLGHRAMWHGFRGLRPPGRPCPRLIASGVPPGRGPGVAASGAGAVRRSSETSAAPVPPRTLRPGRSRSGLVAASPLCTTTLQNPRARREDFSRSAAVCTEHPPQQVGRRERR